jgi:vacuolar-type H+-ATPase subunit F/Vma7
MILLATMLPGGQQCAAALSGALEEPVHLATSARNALSKLRKDDYSVLVIDENLVHMEPGACEMLLRHAGAALPIFVSLGISSAERIVTQVRHALQRAQAERKAAVRIAAAELRDQLKGVVTGILLSSDLALAVPQLPAAAEAKLKSVRELAESMRQQLDSLSSRRVVLRQSAKGTGNFRQQSCL